MTYIYFNNETTRSSVIKAVADTENEAAWRRLFDLYAGFVFSMARHKGLKPEDADDIVQVVFTDLARNLPTFKYDREKGRFRSYLSGLVNWRVIDRLKASKRDADFYAARGAGGCGLVITEVCSVNRVHGRGDARNLLIDTDEAIPSFAEMAKATQIDALSPLRISTPFHHTGSAGGVCPRLPCKRTHQ